MKNTFPISVIIPICNEKKPYQKTEIIAMIST
jgi:hypothetical protein